MFLQEKDCSLLNLNNIELKCAKSYSKQASVEECLSFNSVRLRMDYENSHHKKADCVTHTKQIITHYCRDCKARLCLRCYDQHQEHDMVDNDFIIVEKIENVSAIIDRFHTVKSEITDIINQCDQQRDTIFHDQRNSLDDIESFFNSVHEIVDNIKGDLIMELQQVVDSCLNRLDTNKKELSALRDDVASLADITSRNKSAFECYDLFELEEFAKQKLVHYSKNAPFDYLKPNRLNIQVKWTENRTSVIKHPLAKINCHIGLEKLSRLKTVSHSHANDKRKSYINSMCCDSENRLYLCDAINSKIKVMDKNYSIERCFMGSGKHKLTSPANIVCLTNSNDASESSVKPKSVSAVLVSDSATQRVVSFSSLGIGMDMFETRGCVEAICIVSNLAELENVKENTLELLPIYNSTDQTDISDIYSAQPAAILCSKHNSLQLESLQINPSTSKLYKSRPDFAMSHADCDLSFPRKIAWNFKSRLIFLLDADEHKVVLVSGQNGRFFRAYGRYGSGNEEFDMPSDILVDKEGQVLIADKNNNRIHLVDSTGNFIKFLFPQNKKDDISHPTALCFDNEGNLIVAEECGKLKVFTY